MNTRQKLWVIGVGLSWVALMTLVKNRSERNNNPLNIRENDRANFEWEGEAFLDLDAEFEVFISDVYGYRAAVRILRTYARRGVNTLAEIIATWAPPSENDTENYINSVVAMNGMSRGFVIDTDNIEHVVSLLAAMSRMERGKTANRDDIVEGYGLA